MKLPANHVIVGVSMLMAFAVPWLHGAKTPLDPTRTRIALPLTGPIVIDGVVDDAEWGTGGLQGWNFRIDDLADDGILGAELGSGEKPEDDADLSANIFAGIFDDALYIGVQVIDDDISTDTATAGSENESTWQDDGVEIFIDGDNSNFPDRDTTGTNPEVVGTGGQFVITANNAYRHAEAGNPEYNPSSGWFAETKESADGYHAEFRIPLSMIGNPQPGEHIGFTVAVNDDDGGGDTEGQLIWTGATHVEASYGNLVIGHRRYESFRAAPPTVDGVLEDGEYGNAEVVPITPFTGIYRVGDNAQSIEDHRFEWRMIHDEDAIYVGVRVWDDKIVADTAEANSEDGNTWVDDSIEIFFDSNESNLPGRDTAEMYDGQFVYTTNGAWRDNEANNPTYGKDADWWAQSTVAADGGSWDCEFVVKKATLVGGSTQDAPIGFNININDDDSGERGFQLNWDGSPHNENTYGELILVGCIPSDPGACPDGSVPFGTLSISDPPAENTFTIENTGASQTLTLSDAAITGPNADAFSIVGDFPASIAPGESAEVTVAFNSQGVRGSYAASLTYKTNDPDPTEAELSASLTARVLNLPGPIGHWDLDETGGTEMLDVSAYDRHGAYVDATLDQDPLASGRSVEFSGGGRGEVPGDVFDSFIRFSVSAWVNLDNLGDQQTLFAKGSNAGAPTFALLSSGGNLQWFTNGEPEFDTGGAVLTAGTTHHVVITWSTTQAAIYVDGALVAEQTDPVEIEILQENPFVVGSFFGALNMTGRMDDVQFYNRAITSEDAKWLFENPGKEIGEGDPPGTPITWEAPNPNTTAADLIGGPLITFTPFTYDPNNAEGTFWTGDGGTTGNAELDAVYNSHGWNADGSTITLTGLTFGENYQIQLLGAGDTRACCDTRNQAAADELGNTSGDFERGNTSVIGSFTAASATIRIAIVAGTANGVDPGLSGFILTDGNGALITAANVGRAADGEPITVSTVVPDDPGTLPADSAADFGGPEVDNGWSYGYRNVDLANRTDDYDPVADFIEFPDDWWINDQWDEPNADGDNVPWTSIGAINGHPNGDNNGELHWTIRRWTSPGGPLDVTWSIAKQNVTCGNGVTGAVHHNGVRVDSETLAFDDAVGVQRSVFLITEAGDVLDLIHSPFGTDGTDADGCDGALSSMSIAAGVPPVDGDVLDLLVLGADDTGETGADANVLAFLREVFGADNIRYMNSNATDGSETADVIIMSSTFGSGSVRGKFHNSAVPIVNWEEAVMDNGDGEFGQSTVVMTKSTDTFQMALGDHPIAGDLAGTTIDFFTGAGPETLGSSALSAGTTAVGTAVGGSIDGLAMLFVTDTGGVVDAGSGVVDGVSPARRVALPLTDASFDGLSDDGKQVFVNAIRWAAGAGGEDKAGIDGLLGYWRFDEGSGSTVADSSGNGNDGTIIEPGAAWVSDPGLGSVYQSGGGSYVELGTLPVIGVDTDFTWSFWVNAGETDNNNIVLGNRWSPDGTDFAPREFVKFTPRVFEWHVDGAGQNMPGDNSMFVVGEWAHNLVVKTGPTLTYYRNGVEIATSEIVSAPANAQPLYLGGQNGAENFTGTFDEVAIFGRALSTDEVTDVYNRGLNGESLSGDDISPPPPRAPEITGVSKMAAGVALQFPAGTTYDIEYSTDLETWTLIASDVTDSYSDADAGRNAGAEGYYRGVVKP